ncbi:uncharacterized protein LOC130986090 [Salvia miltiorrhiza]|uniref:uncharacterized protein LOC130986090 n=1 Tax=Salvia miltiorrhiza TaxID=226208 RepID=UPI0025AC0EBC|nr:uncharacterized protein LOC130986090 [Salvia miltiorrhiza]XP_057765353.1 uncharacterized protein LOC130986090 [Salvia miltiorrhiza]XP_057765354.1 uncharacterized protein LOC130986090 [Salvia miltiorrhiza]
MLSTANPPPDLCEISQLKSGDGGSDERDSDTNQQQLGVDLFKSGLDYNNPLPNFSIRDYVFNTRGKDIKNNWPFSQKNLQLCLKHGVKDVLPPFQSLGCVRNPSIEEQPVVDSLRYSDVRYPELSDRGARKRSAVNVENINSSDCEEDKEFPSTTTSQSCSDINSVPPTKNSCSEPEAQYLPVSRSEKPGFAIRESKKAESNIQSPVKKCRLVVKLNNIAELRSNEDSAVISETMASKVCPVCKTFSSSSNTTLNAHIDQCLSGESTVKWTTNTKVIKHRIKPRKTRLMVDIYETALCCTLEDLDKRNGTNWASNMGLHPQDLEASAEEEEEEEKKKKKKTYSPVDFEDISQEGAVYIDSSGTKLRILSKLNHPPSKPNVNDYGACKFVKSDRGIKLLSSKKKKKHTVQRHEVQKNSLDGQGSCSPVPDQLPYCPPHGLKTCYPRVEVSDDEQNVYPPEGHDGDDPTKSPTASDHMRSDDFGMIKQWVGSKRTGLKKKINHELENQHPDKSLKNLRIKSVSSLRHRGNSVPISPISSDENPVLPPEGLKRKENLCRSLDGWTELPSLRKGPGSSLLKYGHTTARNNHLMSSKFNVKQSRKDSTSVHKHHVDSRAEDHAPSRSNKRIGISTSPTVKNDGSFIGSSTSHNRTFSSDCKIATPQRKMSLGHAVSSGGRKFSSLRTKLLSVRHASGAEPKKNLGRDLSSFKNPRLHSTSLSDDEAVVSQPTLDAEDNLGETATLMEKNCGEPLTNRTRVLKLRKRMGGFANTGEGDMMSKGSESSPESDSHNVGNNIDSFIGGSVPVDTSSVLEEEAEIMDDFVCEPVETDGEAFVSFSKSLDSAFPGLSGSNVECVSQYYSKAYDETELVFHADQEMFCADKNLVTPDSHEMAEMDGDEAQGNYFVDVDPIPIPGPPGSFLPSPGRMGSEELLGHSSLTTCRIQSSDDGHEVVDMDSSDSPISAMSTVSNSIAGRSSSISTTNLSAQSQFQHETQHDNTEGRGNPVVEGSPSFERIASGEKDPNLVKSKANLMLPEVSREVQNIQPCCCSRKDVSLQGGSMSYQESQILRRRTMTPLSVLAKEKQIDDDAKNEIRCINLRADTLSEKEPTPPVTGNSPIGYAPMPVPHNPDAMFRACGGCEFPSPSTSNPVLRLMGKNLMVVNKDDDLPSQSSMMIEHPGVRLCVENGLSTRNNLNEPNSFHRMLSRGPSSMLDMQARAPAHQFDFNSSDPFKIPTNYRPSQLSCHPSTVMFPSMSFGDNATCASGCNEYGHGFSLMRPDARTMYDTERVGAHKADSCGGKRKEIIIIDDSPESEAVTNMESRHVNPFYGYQMRVHHHPFNGSAMVPPSRGMNGNLGKRNCTPEGSNVRHSNSSAASLPSSAHLRSLYYSPGFS